MRDLDHLLIRALRAPEIVSRFSIGDWDVFVRQARQSGLLARLYTQLEERALLGAIPANVHWHFEAAHTLAQKQQIAVRWEISQIRSALAELNTPLIVLKGAAYVIAGLPASHRGVCSTILIFWCRVNSSTRRKPP